MPLNLGVDLTTGIQTHAYRRLLGHIDLRGEEGRLHEWPELGAADPDGVVLDRLGSDARGLHDCVPADNCRRIRPAPVHAQAAQPAADSPYAFFAAPWLLSPFERAGQFQGSETFLNNPVSRPASARTLLEKIATLCMAHLGHFLHVLGEMTWTSSSLPTTGKPSTAC